MLLSATAPPTPQTLRSVPMELYVEQPIPALTYDQIYEEYKEESGNKPLFQPQIIGGSVQIGAGDSKFRADNQGMWFGADTYSNAPFRVNLAGTVRASSGVVGGWTLSSSTFTGGNTTLSSTGYLLLGTGSDVARLDSEDATYRLWIGHATAASAPFSVTKAGVLNATGAVISGSITATSGTIGGFTIGASSITAGTTHIILDSSAKAISLNNAVFGTSGIQLQYNGGTTRAYVGDGANQYLQYDGTNISWKGTNTELTAAGALNVSNIVATGGRIANWYINTNTLASDSTEAASNILIDSANSLLRLGPTSGNYITIDGANQRIRSSNFISGSQGAGFNIDSTRVDVGDLHARGSFSSATFEKGAVTAVGGTVFITKGSDVLASDMTALDAATLTIQGNETFAVNDVLRLKNAFSDEWMTVTNANSAPTYTVARDQGAAYSADANPTWQKGTAVVNYGPSGAGTILLTAGENPSPHLDVASHAGSPWTTQTTHLRLGNLNGFLDYTGDLYGIAIGSASAYLKYDPTNGLRLQSTGSKLQVGSGGYIAGAKTSYSDDATEGFFLGEDAGEHKFNIGDATEFMKWTGSMLLVYGGFNATSPISLATYTTAELPIPAVDTGFNFPSATS